MRPRTPIQTYVKWGAVLAVTGGVIQQATRGYFSLAEAFGSIVAGCFWGGIIWLWRYRRLRP